MSKPIVATLKHPTQKNLKHTIRVSLNEEEFNRASFAAKAHEQTIAEWIADIVYTSTQP